MYRRVSAITAVRWPKGSAIGFWAAFAAPVECLDSLLLLLESIALVWTNREGRSTNQRYKGSPKLVRPLKGTRSQCIPSLRIRRLNRYALSLAQTISLTTTI